MSHGIAIVGLACRYADARTPAELWENVLAGRRAFRRIPAERLRLEDYPPAAGADGISLSEAAVLEGWVFDRVRFKVAGPTFRTADLAHWLALDVASRALADAGFGDGEGLPRETTGVLLGNSLTGDSSRAGLVRLRWPYVRRVLAAALARDGWEGERAAALLARLEAEYKAPFPEPTEESLAGGLANTIAGRISNHFDLHGGGFVVDGACASSLLAVAQGCSALAAGDLDAAIAGGVDLSLDPFELVGFARTGALASGDMRVYDARPTGFIPGEGCGIAVLMRESDALARGLRVRAVIRGWGISSDGHGGISRPEAGGQLLALARAYRRAGFGIDAVPLFEGHGTGTAVGDATELAALARARREAGAADAAAIGSVKANIGHTKAAAGAAGLIKATMALEAQVVPPATGCEEPHPEIAASGLLRVPREGEVWPAGRPLYAGVSAMGFGGINVHVVLEGTASVRRRALGGRERRLLASGQDAELLLLAAADAAALAEEVGRLAVLAPRLSRAELGDLAAELARRLAGAAPARARAAVVATSPAQLAQRLAALAGWLEAGVAARSAPRQGLFLDTATGAPRRIGFLFPGQGSPSNLAGGVFRRRCEELAALWAAACLPTAGDGVDTAVAQPAIVAHEVAAVSLLERLGVRGAVAVGHSLGEIAALAWAGALDGEAAVALAAARGRAMAELSDPHGAMASLGAPAEVASEIVAGTGAVVAALNGPGRTVVSGPAAAVEAAMERARSRGLQATRLKVSHAFHSPLVAGAAGPLAEALANLEIAPPVRPVASTVTGGLLPAGADLRALLLAQLTSPVRLTDALAAARGAADLWIEMGPGHALADLAEEQLGAPVLSLDFGGPSLAGLLGAVGAAFAAGLPVDPTALFEGRFTRPFDPDRELVFIGSPCEAVPVGAVDEREKEQERDQVGSGLSAFVGFPGAAVAEVVAASHPPKVLAASHPEAAGAPLDQAVSPLDVVRRLVAEKAELPPEAVEEGSRLLSDLHLNSISVGQLVSEAARRLGLPPPASPTDYAQATVAEVARALEERAALSGPVLEAGPPAGAGSWVAAFVVEHVERPLPADVAGARGAGPWRVVAPAGHPMAGPLAEALEGHGPGVALCLPAEPSEEDVELFLEAARAVLAAPSRFLLVQAGRSGAGFARTLHQELPAVATRVVELPLDDPRAVGWAVAEARAAVRGWGEARWDADGRRWAPVLRAVAAPVESEAPLPLGPDDVLLVSGGGKGIAAECALALFRASGCRLALLGRSDPARDPELARNLERLAADGRPPLYLRCDVVDEDAVAAAVARVEAELGTVTALLHGAGTNAPRLLGALDREGFLATLAPKVRGLEHLLAALDPGRLSLLVAFGSIIAEAGLPGEAEYAVANERLARLVEAHAGRHPACRCLCLEWSVWAGVGMGERLGTLEALAGRGIAPIPPDAGVAALLGLLARPLPAAAVVVAGRFGEPPTVEVERPELPLRRFLERPRVHYPGIELVVDSELSFDSDPYLADHVVGGEALLPAVLGLEAMAQAAMVVAGSAVPPIFEEVALTRPVVVPGGGRTVTVRVAALARGHGRVEVALRESGTGFAADCFRAVCRFGAEGRAAGAVLTEAPAPPALALSPLRDLYGGVLFHGGRFRRLAAYRRLSATECLADLSPDGDAVWFGRWHSRELVLGDPGARDAAIHGIQACIPHATLLPVGVERLWSARLATDEPLTIAARERRRQGDLFVYDVEILGRDGALRERWEGLTLKAVAPIAPPAAWAAALLAPYAERRLGDLIPGAGLSVALAVGGDGGQGGTTRVASDAALRRLVGERAIHRRPDGRPEAAGGPAVSVSHAGGLVLAVAGTGAVGCDLEPVVSRPVEVWRDLLGAERSALADLVVRERAEGFDAAATRVWAAAESLKKAGAPLGAPLVLESATEDGWLLLRSGDLVVGTLLAQVRELGRPAVMAALAETPRARL